MAGGREDPSETFPSMDQPLTDAPHGKLAQPVRQIRQSHVDSGGRSANRFAMLDGWRALSITLVLAAHLLPLGPKRFQLNEAVAAMGMRYFSRCQGFS